MRYAILSDIHANWQAWNAVLLDIGSSRVDRVVCLGDIVGYGPQPANVLESVYKHVHHVVLGNHDAAVCGVLDENLFNDDAAELVRWTRQQLNAKALAFLKSLPLTLSGPSMRCVHGDLGAPAAFHYIIDPEDALPTWKSKPDNLIFVGHSHDPAIFLLGQSGTPHRVAPQDFELETGKRYIVNVGSVGQPRDRDTRASYCIYDTNTQSVYWRRLPFDLDAYRADLVQAGLDPAASHLLSRDPRKTIPPIRELLSFSPPRHAKDGAKDVVEVAQMKVLQRKVKRWKHLAAGLTVTGLAAIATLGGVVRHTTRARTITPPLSMAIEPPARPAPEQNILSFPGHAAATPDSIAGWTVHLGNRHSQSVRWHPDDNGYFVLTAANSRDPLRLESPRIHVAHNMKFCVEAMVHMDNNATGTVATDITLWKKLGDSLQCVEHVAGSHPNIRRKDGWRQAKQTFEIPADGHSITVAIEARLTGQAHIKNITLIRKD